MLTGSALFAPYLSNDVLISALMLAAYTCALFVWLPRLCLRYETSISTKEQVLLGVILIFEALVLLLVWEKTFVWLALCMLVWIVSIAAYIDIKTMLVPRQCVILLFVLRLIFAGLYQLAPQLMNVKLLQSLVLCGLLIGGGLLSERCFKQASVGWGDIKVFCALSLYVDVRNFAYLLLLASVFGVIYGLVRMKHKRTTHSTPFPWLPCIALATFVICCVMRFEV